MFVHVAAVFWHRTWWDCGKHQVVLWSYDVKQIHVWRACIWLQNWPKQCKTITIQWTTKMFLFRFVLKSGLPNARLRSFVDWMSFLRSFLHSYLMCHSDFAEFAVIPLFWSWTTVQVDLFCAAMLCMECFRIACYHMLGWKAKRWFHKGLCRWLPEV